MTRTIGAYSGTSHLVVAGHLHAIGPVVEPAFGGTAVDAVRALIDCVPQSGETTITIACLGIDCRGMEAEYVRGHLGTMILAVLWGGSAHGYGIGAELKRRSDGQLEVLEGSLYPALHRLEEAGWVDSEWEANEGRRRRSYSLTADGKDELRARAARWTAFRSFMDSLLKEADA